MFNFIYRDMLVYSTRIDTTVFLNIGYESHDVLFKQRRIKHNSYYLTITDTVVSVQYRTETFSTIIQSRNHKFTIWSSFLFSLSVFMCLIYSQDGARSIAVTRIQFSCQNGLVAQPTRRWITNERWWWQRRRCWFRIRLFKLLLATTGIADGLQPCVTDFLSQQSCEPGNVYAISDHLYLVFVVPF